jgi:hypothetical protein
MSLGDEDAADAGALLAALGGHLAEDRLDESAELLAVDARVRPEDCRIERVGLGGELGAPLDDGRQGAQFALRCPLSR